MKIVVLGVGNTLLQDEAVGAVERALIEDVLVALAASLHGDYDPRRHFADLAARD